MSLLGAECYIEGTLTRRRGELCTAPPWGHLALPPKSDLPPKPIELVRHLTLRSIRSPAKAGVRGKPQALEQRRWGLAPGSQGGKQAREIAAVNAK